MLAKPVGVSLPEVQVQGRLSELPGLSVFAICRSAESIVPSRYGLCVSGGATRLKEKG